MSSSVRRVVGSSALILIAAALAACPPSPTDIHTAEMMFDLSDALNGLREDNAILQDQIDSLRIAVARQDTVIARLAQSVGLPVQ